MSNEYLERCRELSKVKPVTKCRTVHTSPAYIKLLDHAEKLETRLKEADELNADRLITNMAQNKVIKKLQEQRRADRIVITCGIAGNYITPNNGAPISITSQVHNDALAMVIDVINEHYNEG